MVGYSRCSGLGFGVDVGSLRYSLCLLVILLLLSEESLVGTFLGALCSYEHSAPTHFGFPLGTAVAPRVFAIVATREETRQVSVAFGCN